MGGPSGARTPSVTATTPGYSEQSSGATHGTTGCGTYTAAIAPPPRTHARAQHTMPQHMPNARTRARAQIYGQWTKGYIRSWVEWESIEGGLFSDDKMGRTKFPVYMMGASTHTYNSNSDTGGGWGFFQRRLYCDYLSRITLTNQMLVTPVLYFDDDQDEHLDDGGIFFGMAQTPLPLIGGKHRTDDPSAWGGMPWGRENGMLSWSWIIDTEQVTHARTSS